MYTWHRRAFWYCGPKPITGFSIKMAAILDFCYFFVHVYASNSGGISQENDLIQRIFVSIRPDSMM
jgi:hypothetical protein